MKGKDVERLIRKAMAAEFPWAKYCGLWDNMTSMNGNPVLSYEFFDEKGMRLFVHFPLTRRFRQTQSEDEKIAIIKDAICPQIQQLRTLERRNYQEPLTGPTREPVVFKGLLKV